MRIIYLIYHGFSLHSGVSKKIGYQLKGLREAGHCVSLIYYDKGPDGHWKRWADEKELADYGRGRFAGVRQRIRYNSIVNYARLEKAEMIYIRSFHNANPFTIRLMRKLRQAGIKLVMEIPTYPYDREYNGFPIHAKTRLMIDRIFRRRMAFYLNAIVTFSDYSRIFGKNTIRISNGIDFDSLPLKKTEAAPSRGIHFIGVAEVHYWHGYDRLIAGLGEYYKKKYTDEIFFHIVGGIGPLEQNGSDSFEGFAALMKKYKLSDQVIFHGQKFGKELDDLFEQCQVAIGSLARHRCGIEKIKTLKNREYAARGIPFIYSETDSDFEGMPYVLKIPADETPVNIERIMEFYRNMKMSPGQIRNTISHLSWKEQMQKVIAEVSKL